MRMLSSQLKEANEKWAKERRNLRWLHLGITTKPTDLKAPALRLKKPRSLSLRNRLLPGFPLTLPLTRRKTAEKGSVNALVPCPM